ncbi:MAG: hypothetical protein AAGK32_03845, partial [Actinomycetota bacterium]
GGSGSPLERLSEGVETADQVRYLRSLHCHMAQGYFYSRPQNPDVIDRIMSQTSPGTDGQSGWKPGDPPPESRVPAPAVQPALRS